jgi:hypothetical protein
VKPPGIEPRRFSDFDKELCERAAAWIPSWGIVDGERDFGRALLEIAARFSSDVAERLDRVGDKMALGFLDWLAIRGAAARPARMPVVFKLADTARDPVQAPRPLKMQVDAHGATVTFETETDVRLVPGGIELIVGADPAKDAFFLPPSGLNSLDPIEPLPTQWQLKSFAAAGSTMLQFDPGAGLIEEMLVEIAGAQYRIASVKGDLATIDPPVPAGDGFAIGTSVTKVAAFLPFEQARDQQDHILYLGDSDLFNIEAEAAISIYGASSLGTQASWEYWGQLKSAPSETEPRWRALDVDVSDPAALILKKPQGSIDPREVGAAKARWLRARVSHLDSTQPLLTPDEIAIEINAPPVTPPDVSPIEVIVNTAPSAPNQFFPLGREPRMFDTLYVGSAEAFSKPGAQAEIEFDLVEPSLFAMAAIDAGGIGHVLAGVDKTGALHLLKIANDGTLSPLRTPVVPEGPRLNSMKFRPVLWMENTNLRVAVAADDQVWVWTETWPNAGASKWDSFGSPPFNANDQSKIEGLVAIRDSSGPMLLVALRDKRLSKRLPQATALWVPIAAEKSPQVPLDIEIVVQVAHETAGMFAESLIALEGTGDYDLYAVQSAGAVTALLITMASNVTPAAIERANTGDLEIVAAENATQKLWARQGSNLAVSISIEQPYIVADAAFDVRIEGGQFAAYCVAKVAAGSIGVPDLLAWMPFDPIAGAVLFRTPSDASVGSPQGGLTLHGSFAYMPGEKRGEILAAELGGGRSQWNAPASDFGSALVVPAPAPALGTGDVIAPDVVGRPTPTVADPAASLNGRGGYANQIFIPLRPWLDRDTTSISMPLYPISSVSGFSGTIDNSNQLKLKLDTVNDQTATQNLDWILIQNSGTLTIAQVTAIVGLSNARVATIDVAAAPTGTAVLYWRPSASSITGRIFPTLKLGGGNDNWLIDALDHGGIYFPQLDPQRQSVIAAATDASAHPQWLAFETRWGPSTPTAGLFDFVVDDTVRRWVELQGDNSANPTLSWEYWNGTGWWMLNIDHDETGNLRNSGLVKFAVPPDLGPVEWVGKKNHWVRARLTGGDYGQQTVTVISEIVNSTTTKQTVERSDSGIQPPYALSVSVRYRLGEIKPTYLLTQDSGTLRDQSDANRTSGALIEVFTPMIHTLRQFDSAAAKTADPGSGCVPDCDCPSGTASASPAQRMPAPATSPDTPATPSRTERRAIFLGLTSKLTGEPINILFAVKEERLHDRLAPMAIDALVGNQFVPVVAKDDTRALGETGLVSMSFSVEPTPTELFGRSLSWLRLTPHAANFEWKPTLSGAYLNAVWARAAETMTRELVGASEGAPGLTVQLARPPLLQNSLELRIKEPLGTEERDQLIESDPDMVKSDVTDLPGDWVLWKQVNDPMDCDAAARVYSLDEDTGLIRFGDGQHGAIPPIGPDVIVAFKYERTEPATTEGVPANFVSLRTRLNLVTPVETVEAAIAADQAAGGVGPESGERVLHFGAARLRHRGRIVTARDFEDFALERFADVVQARCFVAGGRIRLVVAMAGADPMPTHSQQRELRRMLLEFGPSTLAASGALEIKGPAVRRLRIQLTLRVRTLDVAGAVASEVKKKLQSFFDPKVGGESRAGWTLGASPHEDDVAEALLDVPGLESIASIALVLVEADKGERPWPASIKKSELAILATDGVRITFDVLEAAA